jgi:hypothetical protein
MALIYMPRQLLKDGKPSGIWRMTVASDEMDFTEPVGACAKDCPGHTTADEAYKHYHEGQLATVTFDGVDDNVQQKCLVCTAWTQRYAVLRGDMWGRYPLCGLHLDMESLRAVYPPLNPKKSQANSSASI